MAGDMAHRYTDKEIKRLSERLRYHYRKAAGELSEKAEKRLSGYAERLSEMQAKEAAGEVTAEQFARWRTTQAAVHARDAAMIRELSESAQRATAEARALISGKTIDVMAECANITAYTIDRQVGRGVLFSLVDRDAVLVTLQRNPRLMPQTLVERASKAKRWHSQKITSAVTRGIIKGESVRDMAKRMEAVSAMDYRASLRAARTALNSAENKGRQLSYERAQQMGLRGQKEWMATLDDLTRDSHVLLDGERVGIDEKFSNGLEEPGDPAGDPEEVWNCRCTMNLVVEEMADAELERWDDLPDGMSYEDWKEAASG